MCVTVVLDGVGDFAWYHCSDFAGGGRCLGLGFYPGRVRGAARRPGWVFGRAAREMTSAASAPLGPEEERRRFYGSRFINRIAPPVIKANPASPFSDAPSLRMDRPTKGGGAPCVISARVPSSAIPPIRPHRDRCVFPKCAGAIDVGAESLFREA